MVGTSRIGFTLVEVLVALVLGGMAAGFALAALLSAARLDRLARHRAATDLARRDTVALRAAAPDCAGAPTAESRPVHLPAAAGRPALIVKIRCGR